MSLIQCPECRAEISSQARFCPRCGYPFEEDLSKPDRKEKTTMVRVRRPFGIFLGVILCIVGSLILFSQHTWILPMYFHGLRWPMTWNWEMQRYFGEFWRHVWISPWQALGLLLLCFGVAQLIFGSSKLKKHAQ